MDPFPHICKLHLLWGLYLHSLCSARATTNSLPLQLRIAACSHLILCRDCPCISRHTLIIEAWALGYHPPITCMCICPGLCWALWGIAGLSDSGSRSLFVHHTAACEKAPFGALSGLRVSHSTFHLLIPQMRILTQNPSHMPWGSYSLKVPFLGQVQRRGGKGARHLRDTAQA